MFSSYSSATHSAAPMHIWPAGAKHRPLAECPQRTDGEGRGGRGAVVVVQRRWGGNNNRVGVKWKGRVQKRTRGDEKREEHEPTRAKNVRTCEDYVVDKVDENSPANGIRYVRAEEKRGREMDGCWQRSPSWSLPPFLCSDKTKPALALHQMMSPASKPAGCATLFSLEIGAARTRVLLMWHHFQRRFPDYSVHKNQREDFSTFAGELQLIWCRNKWPIALIRLL